MLKIGTCTGHAMLNRQGQKVVGQVHKVK